VNLTWLKPSGYTRLSTVNKEYRTSNIWMIAEIKPFRINYYCEQRDPDLVDRKHGTMYLLAI